jgi:hypothetical protein
MKTLSDHPMLIGRLLAADEARRARLARWYRFWHSPWTTAALMVVLVAACLWFLFFTV